jgi:hypothetical protein
MLEALPDEMILYIFDYVISDRTNCRELAKIDDLPESIKAGIRKRYPRGEWGWVNTTRSKFWPYVIISKRIGEVILSDLNRTLKSKIKFTVPDARKCHRCGQVRGNCLYCSDSYTHPVLPHSFYLEVIAELEKFPKSDPKVYYEIISRYEPKYNIRILRWTSIKAANSAQRAVIHKMAEAYGYHHYTYMVTHPDVIVDYHQIYDGWTDETRCEGCDECKTFVTKKEGVLITDEPVKQPNAAHNRLVRDIKDSFYKKMNIFS